jgi:hypothetical protein
MSETVQERQFLWDNGFGKRYESWSAMYIEDDAVVFYYRNFDKEDSQEYDYIGQFSLEDYKKAIEKLQKTGTAVLVEPRGELNMALKNGIVYMSFNGVPCPSATPGGASIFGRVNALCKIEAMILTD